MCFCYNTKVAMNAEKSVTKLFIKLTLFTPDRFFLVSIESGHAKLAITSRNNLNFNL